MFIFYELLKKECTRREYCDSVAIVLQAINSRPPKVSPPHIIVVTTVSHLGPDTPGM
jgi:hypothetical protein